MEYRIDREALAAFVAAQVDLVEAGPVPELLAHVVELRLRHESLGRDEVRALWLAAGLATHVGLAIFEEPERFITAGEPSPATPAERLPPEREEERTMQTIEQPTHRIEEARSPLWLGSGPAAWGDIVRAVDPAVTQSAAEMIAAAGLDWRVEQHSLEAVVEHESQSLRLPVPRHVANVRSDTRAVLGIVGEGYEPLQNRAAFAFCDAITDSGRAHWIGAGSTRGGGRVHALMRLDREIRIGGAEGEDVLPLLCFRNGHDGGLAVTVSVAPFRLACLNGMLLPLADAQRTWKARHTANVEAKLADARRTLGIAWAYYDELEQIGGRLICERMDAGAFERFLARLVPLPQPRPDHTDGGRAVRNIERVREAIRTAYRAAPDLDNVRGTRWGALQAVTAYVDHTQPTRQTAGRSHAEARFERATEPQPLKDRALELLTEGGNAR